MIFTNIKLSCFLRNYEKQTKMKKIGIAMNSDVGIENVRDMNAKQSVFRTLTIDFEKKCCILSENYDYIIRLSFKA